MGQKVRPTGFRTGIMLDWQSTWYASKHDFSELLVEDFKIRKFVNKKYGGSGISKIKIHPNQARQDRSYLLSGSRRWCWSRFSSSVRGASSASIPSGRRMSRR